MPSSGRFDSFAISGRVIALLEPELVAEGFDLLDVRVFQGGGRAQVRIYVDLAEGGIDMGGCAKASRTVGMLMEEADLIAGKYILEVSSPGIRRPLRRLEHFQAVVGQRVDLKIRGRGTARIRGILREVAGKELVVVPEASQSEAADKPADEVRVELGRLQEANLDPDFDAQALINADRRRRKDEKQRQRRERRNGRRSRPRKRGTDGNDEPQTGGDAAED